MSAAAPGRVGPSRVGPSRVGVVAGCSRLGDAIRRHLEDEGFGISALHGLDEGLRGGASLAAIIAELAADPGTAAIVLVGDPPDPATAELVAGSPKPVIAHIAESAPGCAEARAARTALVCAGALVCRTPTAVPHAVRAGLRTDGAALT